MVLHIQWGKAEKMSIWHKNVYFVFNCSFFRKSGLIRLQLFIFPKGEPWRHVERSGQLLGEPGGFHKLSQEPQHGQGRMGSRSAGKQAQHLRSSCQGRHVGKSDHHRHGVGWHLSLSRRAGRGKHAGHEAQHCASSFRSTHSRWRRTPALTLLAS